jgi:hypothetical protein
MPTPSTIDTLPEEIRSEIDRLLIQKVSLDRILAHLRTLSGATSAELPSRSALGRYAAKGARLRERLTRSREMAVAVAKELGDAPGSQQMMVLTELLQTHIFDLMMPDDGEEAELSPKSVGELAKGLKDITTAARGNIEFMKAAEAKAAEAAKGAAAREVERVGRERGISADTLQAIKAGIFGVKA